MVQRVVVAAVRPASSASVQFLQQAMCADCQSLLPAETTGTALVLVRQRTGSSIRDCAGSWRRRQRQQKYDS
jgi:hypothetical protein